MFLIALSLLVAPDPAPPPRAAGLALAHTLKHDAAVVCVALSSDRVASADESGAVYLWDAKTGERLQTVFGANDRAAPVTLLRFSATGDVLLVVTHGGKRCHALECRRPKATQVFGTHTMNGPWRAIGATESGDRWALATGRGAPYWYEVRTDDRAPIGGTVAGFEPNLKNTAAPAHLAATSELLVTIANGTMTGRPAERDGKGWSITLLNVEPVALALSANGARVAVACDTGPVKVYNAGSGQSVSTARGHAGGALAVALSADGSRLASGGVDRAARVWDPRTGAELFALTGHADDVTAVAFAPSGAALATGSLDKTVRLWAKNR